MPLLGKVLTVDGAVPPDTWPISAMILKIGKLNERSANMFERVIFCATATSNDVCPETVAFAATTGRGHFYPTLVIYLHAMVAILRLVPRRSAFR